MTDPADSIVVLGVGNPLMHDDGVGPRVVETLLEGYDFSDNVEILDAGTMSFAILNVLADKDHLIIVDALRGTENPVGSVMRLTPEQVAHNRVRPTPDRRGLLDVLEAIQLVGGSPATTVVAIQVDTADDMVLELSPKVEASVPIAVALVLDELERLGAQALPRSPEVHTRVLRATATYTRNSRSIRSAIDSASNPAIANRSDDAPED